MSTTVRRKKRKPLEPVMGWQQKTALGVQGLKNDQSRANNLTDNKTALTLGLTKDKTTRRGQTQAFALGQADNTTKRRGQDQVFTLGQDRNQNDAEYNSIRRDATESDIKSQGQAFDFQADQENARKAYADALTSGDERIINTTRANLDTFSRSAPREPAPISATDTAKLAQREREAKLKFFSGEVDQDVAQRKWDMLTERRVPRALRDTEEKYYNPVDEFF